MNQIIFFETRDRNFIDIWRVYKLTPLDPAARWSSHKQISLHNVQQWKNTAVLINEGGAI